MRHFKQVLVLATLFMFFLPVLNGFGQTKNQVDTSIQIDSAKYTEATKTNSPQYVNYIGDFEKILDSSTEEILSKLIIEHENKTSDEIAIVTIPTFMPYSNLGDYTKDLSNYLGIGKKAKNNGVMIVLSTTQGALRIGTGLGLEKRLTDSMCQKLIDEQMIPKFKTGDYNQGLIDGVKEIIRLLETD